MYYYHSLYLWKLSYDRKRNRLAPIVALLHSSRSRSWSSPESFKAFTVNAILPSFLILSLTVCEPNHLFRLWQLGAVAPICIFHREKVERDPLLQFIRSYHSLNFFYLRQIFLLPTQLRSKSFLPQFSFWPSSDAFLKHALIS